MREIIRRNYACIGPDLLIGAHRASDLAAAYGTPLYVYDSALISRQYGALRRAFRKFDVFYSLKANPSLAICQHLRRLGACAEIASAGELRLALAAGFLPGDIVLAGPGKSDTLLKAALEAGIFAVHAESLGELQRLDRIAGALGITARAALRINTHQTITSSLETMAGGSSQFGFDEETAAGLIEGARLPNVELLGIHVYAASHSLNVDQLSANMVRIDGLARALSRRLEFELRSVDYGGGFGVPYTAVDRPLDVNAIAAAMDAAPTPPEVPDGRLRRIIESGRYLTAESGVFITRVIDVKISRGRRYVIVDGGINNLIRPALMRVSHPVALINKMDAPDVGACHIAGPLCTPLDVLAADMALPTAEPGDLVGVFNAGAYGYSMSPHAFLGHPRPGEVFIREDGAIIVAREGGDADDLLAGQRGLP